LNVRGAWLHVMSDAIGSVGAIVSAALIWTLGWTWADPLASVFISLLVIHSAWALIKETVSVLMEHAPGHVDVDAVRTAMAQHDGVAGVHDLHVWTITSGLVCLSAHVVSDSSGAAQQATLVGLTRLVRERFGIDHVTIQMEHHGYPDDTCAGCG
jgi:cobalt-zinc-cadmium efflux system protein